MSEEKFDAIVVGAGPAGCAAALTMAQAGLEVVVLERGEYPGAKNVQGGVLYRQPTEALIPGFYEEAPLERPIVRQSFWLTTADSALQMGYAAAEWGQPPYNNFTVLRANFDRWFASKVEEAGGFVINETTVTELVMRDGRVVGVKTHLDEELYADVVIIAQGVNNLLVAQAGLGRDLNPDEAALAVKEVLYLPAEKIEDRFGLEPGQGATIELLGYATQGLVGNGFIYTNKESLSIGVGAMVNQLVRFHLNVNDILNLMKAHPSVKPLLAGAEQKEYMAHLIPEGGRERMPKLFGDGVLVVGDAALMVNAINREGSNMAMISGKLAAETVVMAKERGDFSAATLSAYQHKLNDSFIMKDLDKFKHTTHFMLENPQFFTLYPQMLSGAAKEFFTVDSVAKHDKQARILKEIRAQRPFWRIAWDLYQGWRHLA